MVFTAVPFWVQRIMVDLYQFVSSFTAEFTKRLKAGPSAWYTEKINARVYYISACFAPSGWQLLGNVCSLRIAYTSRSDSPSLFIHHDGFKISRVLPPVVPVIMFLKGTVYPPTPHPPSPLSLPQPKFIRPRIEIKLNRNILSPGNKF